MAYVDQMPETSPMSYSPINTPSPVVVPSSPTELALPVWSEMSLSESMNILFTDPEAVPEFSEESLQSLYSADPMMATYSMYAPTWTAAMKQYSVINGYSSDAIPPDHTLLYVHTSQSNFRRMALLGDIGARYGFSSHLQSIAHQVVHDHFALSQSSLRPDSIIAHLIVKTSWMMENSVEAKNGYARSRSFKSMPVNEITLVGCTYLLPQLKQWLSSDAGTDLTRKSISHYECLFEVSEMAKHRVLSLEVLQALVQATQNSGKIHATLDHQTPEWYSEIMTMLKSTEGMGMKVEDKESVGVNSKSSNSVVNINVGNEEEMEISVKITKVKKQKTVESNSIKSEGVVDGSTAAATAEIV
eukprot:906368-Amphidinium_carterae.1